MLKHIVLAAFLTCGAAAAYAQPQQAASPPASATVDAKMAPSATADTRKLIGRNIKNADGETIGEIKSIYINKDGKVDSVMVGVGGFLGVGDREVRIAWSDLKITDNGEKVMVNMTKDELKAKPEYRYKNETWRGQVFTDTGPWAARPSDTARTADAPRPASDQLAQTTKPPADRATDKPADRPNVAATTSTGDFNAAGEMSGNALIGATVRNDEPRGRGQDRGRLCRQQRRHQDRRGLGRRLPRRRRQGRRGEVERPQVLARRQVHRHHDELDQGFAEGHAGLQVRTASAGQQVGRLRSTQRHDGTGTRRVPVLLLAGQPAMNGLALAS